MKVYHGSTEKITSPLVNVGRKNLDFGQGFYAADLITAEEALQRLSYHKPNNQICIINQEIIERYLHFIESIKIEDK
jgi:hypothetical protein